jgi:hypothetical protein
LRVMADEFRGLDMEQIIQVAWSNGYYGWCL